MILLALGLVLFLGMHSVRLAAPGLRERAIERFGEGAWKGLYALVSLAGLMLVGRGWGEAAPGLLYDPLPGARAVMLIAMLPLLVLLVAGNLPGGRIRAWVGHPMLAATVGWAALHLGVNGDAASVLLFFGFLVWAALTFASLRARDREAALALAPADGSTAGAGAGPHGAAPPDPGRPLPLWPDIAAVLVGAGLYAWLVGGGHEWLFGVSPLG